MFANRQSPSSKYFAMSNYKRQNFSLNIVVYLKISTFLLSYLLIAIVSNPGNGYNLKCPRNWIDFGNNCYFFNRTRENYAQAKSICGEYNSYLLSVLSVEEHQFITDWLRQNDPVHTSWYTSAIDMGKNSWRWDISLNQLNLYGSNAIYPSFNSHVSGVTGPIPQSNNGANNKYYSIIAAFWLPSVDVAQSGWEQDNRWSQLDGWRITQKRAVYNFSQIHNRWGLLPVDGNENNAFICKLNKEDLDFANAVERNIDYGVNVRDPEKIPRGPKFIKEPQDVIFDVSGRSQLNYATLKCVADAYPPPSYKWYKEEYNNRSEIESYEIDPLKNSTITQTDGTLIIYNPQAENSRGKYHCKAENEFGAIISQTVQLTFGYIGEFTKKRSPDNGREYWGKSISCDPPKHHISVSYHWSRNSFEYIVEDDRRTFVSRDGNLYFSSLERIDQANYSCNVKSSIASSGRTGPFFTLIVDSASSSQKLLFPNHFPKIFPDIKLAGSEVRLECMAYGYPVPYYNWTRQGLTTQMPDGYYLTSYNRVLIIPQAKAEDSGEYVCTATSGNKVISKSVQLSIQSMPVILRQIGNKVVEPNTGTLLWECEAFGIPSVSYTWYKNGVELNEHYFKYLSPHDQRRILVAGNHLTIEGPLSDYDQGMYQCKATNELGTAFSSGQLRIAQIAPSFRKHPMPKEMYAAEGGNITIPCVPEALPKPTFEWHKDFYLIHPNGRIRKLPNGFLSITSVTRNDEGKYTCIARNSLGSHRTEGFLRVLNRPKLYVRPDPVYERGIGDSITLPCIADTDPQLDLAYKWLHNGLRIDFDKMPQYSMAGPDGHLLINMLTLAETGEYECIVQTAVGSASATTRIQLYAHPGMPGAVLADDITATSARLHWSPGSQNGRRVLGYQIDGITNHDNTWQTLINSTELINPFSISNTDNGRLFVYLKDVLSPWSTYRFRVSAFNEIGLGPPSEPSPSYNTDKAVPFKAPSNVGGGGGKAGTLTITWDPLPPKDWNGPDIWYRIFYKAADSIQLPYIDRNLTHLNNINMYTVNVGEENYYKEYLVRIQAMNSVGPGKVISEPVVVYSAESMPQIAPSGVNALAYNSTALNVTWSPLDSSREKIRGRLIGHRIKYWKMNQDPQYDALTLLKRGTEAWSIIVGLLPDTEYYIAVMAYNEAGSGPESEPFLARTFKAAPQQPPTSVNVTLTSTNSVLVTWRGISSLTNAEEPISGYKVRYWETDQPISRAREIIKPLDGSDLRAIISDLVEGKVYKLRVLAFSNGGDGKMSQQIEFKLGGKNYDENMDYHINSVQLLHSNIQPLIISSFLITIIFCFMN